MQDYSTLPLFSLQPETREIPLTKGYVAIVDAADFEWLNRWKWRVSSAESLYACRTRVSSDEVHGKLAIFLHRVVIGAPDNMMVDHINRNTLDNTRANLRLATNRQNICNQPGWAKPTSSEYKGVSLLTGRQRWGAQIRVNGKKVWLGSFVHEVDAALAYNEAAIRYHGEFAYLNDVSIEAQDEDEVTP